MPQKGTREASHAGSWYDANAKVLLSQLDDWLDQVPSTLEGSKLPIPKARVIIAPHAGYSYSGPCAAWAYKALDLSKAKRVFILGPSHTYYLHGCALTTFAEYETPFGNLKIDDAIIQALSSTGKFENISRQSDVAEHSLEMHVPYIWKRLEQTHGKGAEGSAGWPTIVPILIGDNSGREEKAFGELLAPYFSDPENAFVVSSDFCHWGKRFQYTAYVPDAGRIGELKQLSSRDKATETPIHEGIKIIDQLAIDAVASGKHDHFVDNLRVTKNTVCGRHPIGVTMAALESVAGGTVTKEKGKFTFVQYDRSSLVEDVSDSSVSYAAAYAII